MRYGLHALGIGSGAQRAIIDAVAAGAEERAFATLWCGEHVVMVDTPASRYPYAADGRIPVPADADWLDPLVCLSFAGAATDRIGLATGVLLLPEHNAVLLAKQAASVDRLTGGRLSLGVGVGWSAEEFAALGVPFDNRGRRMDDAITALRTLWRDDVATLQTDTISFERVRLYPKPHGDRAIPLIIGGNSDAALRRAVRTGDGWYGFNLTTPAAEERIGALHELCRRHGRDRAELTVAVAPAGDEPDRWARLEALGVDEAVVVAVPPDDPRDVAGWLDALPRS
jgi:probable F420-dependent oxidoreductase